jgi:hypothetical protein
MGKGSLPMAKLLAEMPDINEEHFDAPSLEKLSIVQVHVAAA